MGKRDYILGESERLALQSLVCLRNNAYDMTIRREIEARLGRNVAIGAVYTVLERLEEGGFVSSRKGEATPERGERVKRYYKIEAPGVRALSGEPLRTLEYLNTGLMPVGG